MQMPRTTLACEFRISQMSKEFVFIHYLVYQSYYSKIQFLGLSDALNLDDSPIARRNGLKTRARGHWLGQEINVHFVHGGEILHIGQIDIVFDNLIERRASQFENFLEVLQDGALEWRQKS